MPNLIREFQARYPNVQFILHQGDYSSIQEWIKNGAVDFGFVTPPAETGLETIEIKEGRMVAILPANHRLELVLRKTNYNIVMLPVNPPVTRTLAIGFKEKDSLPIASKYFIEFLMSNIGDLA